MDTIWEKIMRRMIRTFFMIISFYINQRKLYVRIHIFNVVYVKA